MDDRSSKAASLLNWLPAVRSFIIGLNREGTMLAWERAGRNVNSGISKFPPSAHRPTQ